MIKNNVKLLPLLNLQKDLYMMPKDISRFQNYLRVMLTDDRNDLKLPLTDLNPKGNDKVLNCIQYLIDLEAETIISIKLDGYFTFDTKISLKLSIIVVDDLGGGWTNRYIRA